MIKTTLLGLPIYDNPSEDKFKLTDWNIANENIERAFASALNGANMDIINNEIVEARMGKESLGEKVTEIDLSLETIKNDIDEIDTSLETIENDIDEIDISLETLNGEVDKIDTSLETLANEVKEIGVTADNYLDFRGYGGDVGGGITIGGQPLKIDNYHTHCVTVDYGDRIIIDIGNAGHERGAYLVSLEINHNPNGQGLYWSSCNILLTHEVIYDTSTSRVVQRLSTTFLSQGSTDFQWITKFIWATTQGSDKELGSTGSAHMSILKPTDVEVGRFLRSLNIIKLSYL